MARRRTRGYTGAQRRSIAAALGLFAEHGVAGTSLQMIADEVGVTKAAIYHQFKSKEAIVIGVAEELLSDLEGALARAEAEPPGPQSRFVLLSGIIDLSLERRAWIRVWLGDPALVRILTNHQPYLDLMNRVYSLLAGREGGTSSLVRTALLTSAISGATANVHVSRLDNETLRSELRSAARQLFDLPDSAGRDVGTWRTALPLSDA